MILVTGSSGLIGRHLCSRLESGGLGVRRLDVRAFPSEDIRDEKSLRSALQDVSGVVHLAAISRVVWAQNDPELCQATNVRALQRLVDICLQKKSRPWLIFASSREVYGNSSQLPVHEDQPSAPVNVYGRSKQDGERIVQKAREAGLIANICRFSNVYGCALDHKDRVAMAFAAAAARGGLISVEGSSNTLDFTAVADVVDGLSRLIRLTGKGERLPPIHFASGKGTTLQELAELAATFARNPVKIVQASARSFDVSSFIGDTSRAEEILGWRAQTGVAQGVAQLVASLSAVSVARAS